MLPSPVHMLERREGGLLGPHRETPFPVGGCGPVTFVRCGHSYYPQESSNETGGIERLFSPRAGSRVFA